ncbi:hypothetical protein I545_3844 [Mycobacterium kansasii 662]|uniref:Uncharacterized protein n=2 Tax=Mycobacterium kansasii TaxID=1768 RepID=A0A1V3XFB9_MYCKA|nr:hypothetical protein I545_3844 [Mycobacterium kansasii 662]KEP41764.1 hypothetical protein MKSMC1_30290 [Mycobacterium kansasii]OOK77862.1 hypothetical protein BZL29_3604 [Mycobacterium kansasii]
MPEHHDDERAEAGDVDGAVAVGGSVVRGGGGIELGRGHATSMRIRTLAADE